MAITYTQVGWKNFEAGGTAMSADNFDSMDEGIDGVYKLVNGKGDLIVATAADTLERLGVGSDNQILTADPTAPTGLKWAAAPSGITTATIDAKGDPGGWSRHWSLRPRITGRSSRKRRFQRGQGRCFRRLSGSGGRRQQPKPSRLGPPEPTRRRGRSKQGTSSPRKTPVSCAREQNHGRNNMEEVMPVKPSGLEEPRSVISDGAGQLAEIRRRVDAVGDPRWVADGKTVVTPEGETVAYCRTRADAEFVANSLGDVELLAVAVGRVRDLFAALASTGSLGRDALKAADDASIGLVISPLLEDAVLPLLLSDGALSVTADLARALSEDD